MLLDSHQSLAEAFRMGQYYSIRLAFFVYCAVQIIREVEFLRSNVTRIVVHKINGCSGLGNSEAPNRNEKRGSVTSFVAKLSYRLLERQEAEQILCFGGH